MEWAHYWKEYRHAEAEGLHRLALEIATELSDSVPALSDRDRTWVLEVLATESPEKDFVAEVLLCARTIPDSLVDPLLESALNSPQPRTARALVEVCVRRAGSRGVLERLLERMQKGSSAQRAGAIDALDWARPQLEHAGGADDGDLWATAQKRMLDEFLVAEDEAVQSSILRALDTEAAAADPQIRESLDRVVEAARKHPSAYIRRRVEILLGRARLVKVPGPESRPSGPAQPRADLVGDDHNDPQ